MAVDIRSPEMALPTSPRDDLITVLLGTWLTIGGFVDGFAHRNLDTPETFFTPWHGILYSGFAAVSAWVVFLMIKRRQSTTSLRESIPAGYGTTVGGIVVFMAGGIGDGLWHTFFGIEVSIDALLSPTHLMLLVGALLILSGPFRSRWQDPHQPTRVDGLLPPLLAVTMGAAEVGFFFQYVDGLSNRFMQVPYSPGPEEGYFELVAGLSSILITTVILVGALLLLMKRWRLPPGSALLVFTIYGALMEVLEGYQFPEDIIAPVLAGIAAEGIIAWLETGERGLAGVRVIAFLVPVTLWVARFVVFEQFSDIAWPTSVWTGAIVLAGLTGVGLSLLSHSPSRAHEPAMRSGSRS